ncbi:MAG TPA: O-antigen ligase family protein [Blastocatellia bacterium]|nr:O-antigen ligase family protein [Blastocatellia bacterium]HMV82078.1 O-antigen ligase family protein [Blastocatellia bacterium]HMX25940.1 O-antigen ligase family protein [Blastocatellia bacterium]HMY70494.1 O-antigen ligase family protein [Blastocatellia bacterium]HMZ17923.1 O-antigen ligase family protein [Blastocatellia bacterium]
MNPAIILAFIVGSFLWLFRYRFRDNFLRAYGFFFLILLIYATNKAYYGISPELSESMFSPLSLIRWGLLFIFAWQAWRLRMPGGFRQDAKLAALVVLLLFVMLASAFQAEDFNYSFLRAVSFAVLAFAVMKGLTFHLFSSVNCLRLFQLKYYAAWIMIAPAMLMLLTGLGYGITVMGYREAQFAGFFGNPNMLAAFSALVTPYVLFHWKIVAQKRWEKWLDGGLLLLIFGGQWVANSRNGVASSVLAATLYFFVIDTRNRLRIAAGTVCLLLVLAFSQSVQNDMATFVAKDVRRIEQSRDFSSQMASEERMKMWVGVWPEFWKRKLTGYGFAVSHVLAFPFTRDQEAGRSLHNSYLEIFGDLGLPGLLLLLLILYGIAAKCVALMRQRSEPLEANINAVFISIFAAGTINAFFESWMFSVGNLISLLYWAPAAGVVARWAWRPAAAREPLDAAGVIPQQRYGRLQPQLERKVS